VHEVHVDVEQVGNACGAAHDVAVPELLGERLAHRLAIPVYEIVISLRETA
jgi:hypothetical protein